MFKELRGGNLGQAGAALQTFTAGPDKQNVTNVLGILKQLGLADVPIAQLLEKIGPYTISQLAGLGGKYLESGPKQ